ncbi:MAG: triphosphoribosyl-dephospho-CoA synthase [Hyphomicrobiales bacterium]|nr:triphosphoribosyl-dephospho-CoA synthase [Hyphomicrobiales bacterium]
MGTFSVAQAFIAACEREIAAPKPGNVHVYAGGHAMSVEDFRASARAAAPGLAAAGQPIGARVRAAVEATWRAVAKNTNLGICLLCAPLAAAAEQGGDLRAATARLLEATTIEDAENVFAAIRRAAPGGLGEAPRHDVRERAAVTLREAMHAAADRDFIAAQYDRGFTDLFAIGLPALADAAVRWRDEEMTTLAVYLAFLSEISDSHIQRKFGRDVALSVQRQAAALRAGFMASANRAEAFEPLLLWDEALKARGLNPGTSADATVAILFASRLMALLQARGNDD